jgi:phosphatidylglycerophosphatase A
VTKINNKSITDRIVIFLSTGAYSGYSPFAPGTAGTLAAIPIYLLFYQLGDLAYLLLFLVLLPLSFAVSARAEKLFGAKDSGMIVIDEIAGYLATMFMIPFSAEYIIIGFFLFRFFDITKIYPASAAEKMGGGPGVVMDDVVAGIYANLSLRLLIFSGLIPVF